MNKDIVFIGSSAESLNISEAVQLNISKMKSIHPICWHQGVFKISNYPIDDLLEQLNRSCYGIFILAKDDFLISRGKKSASVRDNVLFEMGMYMGLLGKERTYFITPKSTSIDFHIPSDLIGLTSAQYELEANENVDSVVGPACTQIKRKIAEQQKTPVPKFQIEKFGWFQEFDSLYVDLFKSTNQISTSFIHSRRWRETNLLNIEKFFNKSGSSWDVFLPNLADKTLINK